MPVYFNIIGVTSRRPSRSYGWFSTATYSFSLGSADKPNTQKEQSKWRKGEFVNEWGDKSGDFFMLYDGQFRGRYENSVTNMKLEGFSAAYKTIFDNEE